MISEKLQEETKQWVSEQEGSKYPCGNQIVGKYILLADKNRIKAFEQAYPRFVCYRRTINDSRYIDSRSEELWKINLNWEKGRGYRYHKAIIDSTIDEDKFKTIIRPYLCYYCCSVEFF